MRDFVIEKYNRWIVRESKRVLYPYGISEEVPEGWRDATVFDSPDNANRAIRGRKAFRYVKQSGKVSPEGEPTPGEYPEE